MIAPESHGAIWRISEPTTWCAGMVVVPEIRGHALTQATTRNNPLSSNLSVVGVVVSGRGYLQAYLEYVQRCVRKVQTETNDPWGKALRSQQGLEPFSSSSCPRKLILKTHFSALSVAFASSMFASVELPWSSLWSCSS